MLECIPGMSGIMLRLLCRFSGSGSGSMKILFHRRVLFANATLRAFALVRMGHQSSTLRERSRRLLEWAVPKWKPEGRRVDRSVNDGRTLEQIAGLVTPRKGGVIQARGIPMKFVLDRDIRRVQALTLFMPRFTRDRGRSSERDPDLCLSSGP